MKIFDKNKRDIYFLILVFLYFLTIFFTSYTFAVGVFLIAAALVGLKKHKKKHVILLLSPLIVYPIYAFLFLHFFILIGLGPEGLRHIGIPLIVFGIFYGYLLRDFWKWVEPKIKETLLLVIFFLGATVVNCSILLYKCRTYKSIFSGGERSGGLAPTCSISEAFYPPRPTLESFNLYNFVLESISITGPVTIIAMLMLLYFFTSHKKS